MLTGKKFDAAFYQAMKTETKKRKIKLSAEHDIYKKIDPYFFNVFYASRHYKDTDGKVVFMFDVSVKYHRFDELQYGILCPGEDFHFTDKIRANSGALCRAAFPRFEEAFDCDGSEESLPGLAAAVLDFLEQYIRDFLRMVRRDYGDLNEYYIANREAMPRLAGLACLDKGDYEGAIECFSHSDMDGQNNQWIVHPETQMQRKRARANGYLPQISLRKSIQNVFVKKTGEKQFSSGSGSIFRSRKEQFIDYAVALKNGVEWTYDRAMFGLLPEEREAKNKIDSSLSG